MDGGSTLPLYIWLTSIILFVALAFFVFAQAAVARGGAQSAADAAALAAAQESRDELLDELVRAIEHGDEDWMAWFTGNDLPDAGAERAAASLASANDADVSGLESVEEAGYPGYSVEIRTRYTVGESIIPGTESKHAFASATAVIKPKCEVDGEDPKKPVELLCDEGLFEIDPADFDPKDLPDATALFSVHLAE